MWRIFDKKIGEKFNYYIIENHTFKACRWLDDARAQFSQFQGVNDCILLLAHMKITKIMLSTDLSKNCQSLQEGRCTDQDFWLFIMRIQKLFSFSAPLEGACPSLSAQTTTELTKCTYTGYSREANIYSKHQIVMTTQKVHSCVSGQFKFDRCTISCRPQWLVTFHQYWYNAWMSWVLLQGT